MKYSGYETGSTEDESQLLKEVRYAAKCLKTLLKEEGSEVASKNSPGWNLC